MPQQQYFNPATGKPVYFDPATGQQVPEPGQTATGPTTGTTPVQGSGRGSGAGPTGQRPRIGGRAGYQSNDPDEPIVEPNPFEKMDKFMATPLTTAPSRWGRAASEFIDPTDPIKGRSTGGLRGASSAFFESLGDVGTSMTTPESLAITALTAGEGMAAKQGSKFLPALTAARRVTSAPAVGHGIVDLAEGNTTSGLVNMVMGGAGVGMPAPRVGGGAAPNIDLTPPAGGRVVTEARVLKSIANLESAKSPSAAARAAEYLLEDIKAGKVSPEVAERANKLIEYTKSKYPEQFKSRTEPRKSMTDFVEGIKQADEVSRQFGTERAEDTLGAIARPGEEVTSPISERRAPGRTGPSLTDEQFLASVQELAGEGTPAELYAKVKNLPQVPIEVKQRLQTIMGATSPEMTAPPAVEIPSPKLPQGLRGASPRYREYDLHFTNDLEKALYIVAQNKPSARNADYLRFIEEHTGLGPVEAKALGQKIKERIAERVKSGGDEVDLTGLLTAEDLPQATAQVPPPVVPPQVPPPTAGAPPTGGVPPTGGPPTGGQPPTPPIPPNRPAPIPTPPSLPISTRSPRFQPDVENAYQKVSGVIRSVLTSYDLSALRQGKGLITHPEYWTNIKSMFQAWGSQKGLDSIHQSIVQDPSGYFTPSLTPASNGRSMRVVKSLADEAGLDLSPGSVNERWGSKFAANLPGVAASQRAFEGYILKLRADVFKKLYAEAEGLGRGNPTVAKEIAKVVNTATGAGGLGGLEKSKTAMKVLNEMFFAPKYNASRMQMYTQVLNPKLYTTMDPIVRREALRSLLGVAGTGLLLGELGRFAGAQVSNDPTSSDFRKMRFGDTRIDNFAGLQQYGVAATRLLSGDSTSSTTGRTFDLANPKFGGQTRLDVMENLIESKAAPIPSFIMGWMRGKEFDGTPFEAKSALAQRIAPIVTQDLYALYKENPALIPAFLIPIIFGEGVQTYGR